MITKIFFLDTPLPISHNKMGNYARKKILNKEVSDTWISLTIVF